MAFAPLYNKIAELEERMSSMSGGQQVAVSSPVDLDPIYSKLATLEEKMSAPSVPSTEYATAESVSLLVDKYNQITSVLTQFNMQLSSISERLTVLESK
jgi:hypothetical protein